MTGAGFLDVERLSVRYGTTPVLHELSLAVAQGRFVALLGASGCGKTTLLRTIAGFIEPFAGRLAIAGRDITRLPPDRRGMAMVFQSYALWPHMSVVQNIGYGLKLRGVDKAAIGRKVGEILAMLGLDGLGERNVTALSGGQRQRVALGRALDLKLALIGPGMPGQPMYYVQPRGAEHADLAASFIELATSPAVQAEGIVERFNWYPGIDAEHVQAELDDATWQRLFADVGPEDLASKGKPFPIGPYFDQILEAYERQVTN